MDTLVKKYLPLLHSDKTLRNYSLRTILIPYTDVTKILLSPSLYPNRKITKSNSIISCNSCDICKNYIVFENIFICAVTDKKYFAKCELHCNYCSVIYLVQCSNCKQQYVGSALNFKQWFRINKSDIKTNKDHCETARHFNNVCCHPSNPHFYLKVQFIEQVFCNDVYKDIEAILWERDRKRNGCRKK